MHGHKLVTIGLAGALLSFFPVDAAAGEGPTALVPGPVAQGQFDTRIANLLAGGSRLSHHLVDGPQEIELTLPDGMEIPRGATVRVHGHALSEGVMSVDNFEVLIPAPIPTIDPEQRPPRRIATILVFWGSQGLQNADARDRMFLGAKSTNVFYGENSYGKDMMAGNVFGPYEIDEPTSCNTSFIADQAMQRFADKGHDRDDYIQFMFHFPGGIGCSFGGLASLGSPDAPAGNSWYNNSFGCVVRNQELAHNYGLSHSRKFTCDGGGQDCLPPLTVPADYPTNLEYGDPYDPMGNGCAHINVVHKTKMGWLEGCNVVTASTSASFNISPTELPCNGTQALRFPTSDGRHYWLEYRQPLGQFDGGISGVILHVGTTTAQSPYFVDIGTNGLLHVGDSFVDPTGDFSFTIAEENPTHAVVNIVFLNGTSDGEDPVCLDGSVPGKAMGNWGTVECAAEPFPLDTEEPTVEITYPANNEYFEPGSDFTITALGMDNRIVTELELYLDGQPVHKVFTNPGEWQVVGIPKGTYEMGVVASDGPNFGLSEGIRIYVGEDPPGGGTTTGEATDGDDGTTTGEVETTGTTTTGPTQTEKEGACACSTGNTPGPAPAFAGLGLLYGLRIRRRSRRRGRAS